MSNLISKKRVTAGLLLGLAGVTIASTIVFAATGATITTGPGPTGYGRPTGVAGEATPAEAEAQTPGTNYAPTVWTVAGSNLKISGSTTVYPILNAAMLGFVSAQAALGNTVIYDLKQGGSGVGRTDGGLGLNDLAASSSAFKTPATSLKWGAQTDNVTPMWDVVKVARDGICVILNESVNNNAGPDVTQLTMGQIKNIYSAYNADGTVKPTGITNWNQLGGPNMPIVPIAREIGGGTRTSFLDFIGVSEADEIATINATGNHRGEGNPGVIAIADSTTGVANGAIAYVGLGFSDPVEHPHVDEMAVSKDSPISYILPTAANIYSLTYPLSRFLQVGTLAGWTNPRPGAAANAAAFEQYLWTEAGQQAVKAADFLKLWPDQDVTQNGVISVGDVSRLGLHWGETTASSNWDVRSDVTRNGVISVGDVSSIGLWWGFTYNLP